MQFFSSAVDTLQTLVIAPGAGLAVWGVVNLLEGYGPGQSGRDGQGACRKQLLNIKKHDRHTNRRVKRQKWIPHLEYSFLLFDKRFN